MISIVDPALIDQVRELGMTPICDDIHAKESSDEGGACSNRIVRRQMSECVCERNVEQASVEDKKRLDNQVCS